MDPTVVALVGGLGSPALYKLIGFIYSKRVAGEEKQIDVDGQIAMKAMDQWPQLAATMRTEIDRLHAEMSDLRKQHAADCEGLRLQIAGQESRIKSLEDQLRTAQSEQTRLRAERNTIRQTAIYFRDKLKRAIVVLQRHGIDPAEIDRDMPPPTIQDGHEANVTPAAPVPQEPELGDG